MIETILRQKGPKLPQTKALFREATYSQHQIDHVGPLTCIFNVHGPSPRILRWTYPAVFANLDDISQHSSDLRESDGEGGGGGKWVLFPTAKPVFMANIDDAVWFIAKTYING